MTDEVIRLRRLRKTALKVRALASYSNSSARSGAQHTAVYDRAKVLHWHIARIATGRLRSHPYLSFQSDQGFFETRVDRCVVYLGAMIARLRGQGTLHLLGALNCASRELDDTRALTMSGELSETLGRAQMRVRALIEEVRGQLPAEMGYRALTRGKSAQTASPYLAL